MIDSASIRSTNMVPTPNKDDRSRCKGRSHGGLTTKIHAMVDASSLLIWTCNGFVPVT
jgi:hypothetical protein